MRGLPSNPTQFPGGKVTTHIHIVTHERPKLSLAFFFMVRQAWRVVRKRHMFNCGD